MTSDLHAAAEPIEKTCLTCHWWFRFTESQLVGDCVWHNGTKKTPVAKLRFSGILRTLANFGCVDWAEDRRGTQIGDDA